jgi:tetratricopeptide (TPR) repeat protein
MHLRFSISFLFVFLLSFILSAQNEKADSLLRLLSGSSLNKATVLNDIADVYYLSNPDSSLYYAEIAAIYATNADNKIEKSRAFNRIAMYYSGRGEQKKVMFYLIKSLDNATLSNDSTQLMKVHNNLGIFYYDMVMYDSAITNLKKAISYVPHENAFITYGNMFNNLGLVYHEKGDYKLALSFYEKALEIYMKEGDTRGIGIANGNLGRVYFDQGKNSEALKYMNICAVSSENEKDYANLAIILMNTAEVYEKMKDVENAVLYLNKSLAIAEENNFSEVVLRIYQMGANIYEDAGNYKEALYYQKQFKLMNDSIQGVDLKQEISDMKMKYETERKNQEIIVLNKEKEISQERSKMRGYWVIALIIGVIVLASFMLFFLNQKIALTKANKELVRKNIEIAFIGNPDIPQEQISQLITTEYKEPEKEIEAEENGTLMEDDVIESKYPYSKLTIDQKKELSELILHTMNTDKPYMDSEFTINKLAVSLDKSRTYISQVVNEYYHKNFKNFINEFRIKEACRILVINKNYTIEAIAREVGFKSKSSFNVAFKYYTGLTPTTFIKHALGKGKENIAEEIKSSAADIPDGPDERSV